ncbi:MAG: YdeI/OmpD-associated family protein [Bacillota bacterium]
MYEFDAVLSRLEGKMPWTVLYVPFSVSDEFGTNGRLAVKAVIDGHEFRGTLLPSRNGHYMAFNKGMQSKCGKSLGDTVHVVMEEDTDSRTVRIPHDVEAALTAQDVMVRFRSLAPYIQREEINRIEGAKTSQTRMKRVSALAEKLS